MADVFKQVLSTNDFMPDGTGYRWQPGVLRLHVISDSLIALGLLLYFLHAPVFRLHAL